MKKLLALLLALFLFIAAFTGCDEDTPETKNPNNEGNQPPVQDNANPASDFEFIENEDGGITITRYIGTTTNVTIPAFIQDKPVTQIGTRAFVTKNTLLQHPSNAVISLQMPDTITIIGDSAFQECDQLEEVALSKNIAQIGACAFMECTKLSHVRIPSKTRRIEDEAFDGAGLKTVIFEEGIEAISGYGAFAHTKLKQVTFPSTVKEIGNSAFAACLNLESVVLNDGLVTIGHKAFCENPKLAEIVIPKTVTYVTEMAFTGCGGLQKVMFDGNAPNTFEYSDSISGVWKPYDVHFTIYYHEGASGFASPNWYGYQTEIW